jgi:SAM-dependent methyltransferase
MDEFLAANRANWGDRAKLHATDPTGSYRIDEVVAGGDSLYAIEAAELGSVAGRRIIHLQCHIGLDTISLARRGAIATGLDFSPHAIAAARDIAARAGHAVRFVEANVYDAPAALGETYDMAFVTWGTITWLPDIARWARVVADVLAPGGVLYFADTHPLAAALEEVEGRLTPTYAWRTRAEEPLAFDQAHTYTGDRRALEHRRAYNWIHPISDLLTALAAAGLRLDWLHEHELLPYRLFPMMTPAGPRGLFELPAGIPRVPLSLSLMAHKAKRTNI